MPAKMMPKPMAASATGNNLQALCYAAIYRFAVDGSAPAGFDTNSLTQAFRAK